MLSDSFWYIKWDDTSDTDELLYSEISQLSWVISFSNIKSFKIIKIIIFLTYFSDLTQFLYLLTQ